MIRSICLLLVCLIFCVNAQETPEVKNELTTDELLSIVAGSELPGIFGIDTDPKVLEQALITCDTFCKLPNMTVVASGPGLGAGENVVWLTIPCQQERACDHIRDYLNVLKEEGWYQPTTQVFVFRKDGREEFPLELGAGLCRRDGSGGWRVFRNQAPPGFESIRVETGFHEAARGCYYVFQQADEDNEAAKVRQSIAEIVPQLDPPQHVHFDENAGMKVYQHITTSASDHASIRTDVTLEGISMSDLMDSFETQLGETQWQKTDAGEFSVSTFTEWQLTDTKGAIWKAILTVNGDANEMAKSVQWFITLESSQ